MNVWFERVLCMALLVACAASGCSRAEPKNAQQAKRGSRERASQWRESASREVRTSDAAVAARKQREATAAAVESSAPPPDVFEEPEGRPDIGTEDEADESESEDEKADDGLLE